MAHRHNLEPHHPAAYIDPSIELLKVLGNGKGAREISIASHLISASRTCRGNQHLDSYGQHVDWGDLADAVDQLEKARRDRGGYFVPVAHDGHLRCVFGSIEWKMGSQSSLDAKDRQTPEMRDSLGGISGGQYGCTRGERGWLQRLMITQELIDKPDSCSSTEEPETQFGDSSSQLHGEHHRKDGRAPEPIRRRGLLVAEERAK